MTRKGQRIYQKVRNYIKENGMLRAGDTVIAGVSGGGDSMAMLSMLAHCREGLSFSLSVVHVNHGLRGEEADRDQALVEEYCRNHRIPCTVFSYPVRELARQWKTGEEEAGRNVRRESFRKEAERLGADPEHLRIALAHNRDDLAETLLHNLCRGSGPAGLASMRPAAGEIIRPVLCLGREEIRAYVREERIPHLLDSSNLSDEYTRNRIRHHILPLLQEQVNSRAAEHMAETAGLLAGVQDYMERQGERLLQTHGVFRQRECFLREAFFQEDPAVVSYGILCALERLAGCRKDLSAVHVHDLEALSRKQVGRRLELPYGLKAERIYGGVRIIRTESSGTKTPRENVWALPLPGQLDCPLGRYRTKIFPCEGEKIEEKKYTKWFDYDKIEKNLSVRTRRTGDFLVVNREGGTKKLNRYMIDEKIPGDRRDTIPLVAAEEEILWVTGRRMSEKYKVTSQTKRILEVEYKGGYTWDE